MKELLLTLIAGLFFLIGVVINKINKGSKKVISFSIGMAFSSLILLLITDIIPETFELLENKIYILLNKKSKNIKMGQEVVVPEKSVKGKSTI